MQLLPLQPRNWAKWMSIAIPSTCFNVPYRGKRKKTTFFLTSRAWNAASGAVQTCSTWLRPWSTGTSSCISGRPSRSSARRVVPVKTNRIHWPCRVWLTDAVPVADLQKPTVEISRCSVYRCIASFIDPVVGDWLWFDGFTILHYYLITIIHWFSAAPIDFLTNPYKSKPKTASVSINRNPLNLQPWPQHPSYYVECGQHPLHSIQRNWSSCRRQQTELAAASLTSGSTCVYTMFSQILPQKTQNKKPAVRFSTSKIHLSFPGRLQ